MSTDEQHNTSTSLGQGESTHDTDTFSVEEAVCQPYRHYPLQTLPFFIATDADTYASAA